MRRRRRRKLLCSALLCSVKRKGLPIPCKLVTLRYI
jgi:hypothetical protein